MAVGGDHAGIAGIVVRGPQIRGFVLGSPRILERCYLGIGALPVGAPLGLYVAALRRAAERAAVHQRCLRADPVVRGEGVPVEASVIGWFIERAKAAVELRFESGERQSKELLASKMKKKRRQAKRQTWESTIKSMIYDHIVLQIDDG